MGATRDVALSVLDLRGISVNTTETAITVVASDSGVLFVNSYASACTYTLPTVALAKGKWFWFFCKGAGGMAITSGTASKMVCLNSAAATTATFSTTSQKIGAAAIVTCDGTNYFFTSFPGFTVTLT